MPAIDKDAKQMYVFEAEETKTRSIGTTGKTSENKATGLVSKVTSLLKPKNLSSDARALNPAKELSE